jgi:hypothetical protein
VRVGDVVVYRRKGVERECAICPQMMVLHAAVTMHADQEKKRARLYLTAE